MSTGAPPAPGFDPFEAEAAEILALRRDLRAAVSGEPARRDHAPSGNSKPKDPEPKDPEPKVSGPALQHTAQDSGTAPTDVEQEHLLENRDLLENQHLLGNQHEIENQHQPEHPAGHEPLGVDEATMLAEALATKFEELSLIHQLTESLELHADAAESCQPLVDQIHDCIAASIVAIELEHDEETDFGGVRVCSRQSSKCHNRCVDEIMRLAGHWLDGCDDRSRPLIVNPDFRAGDPASIRADVLTPIEAFGEMLSDTKSRASEDAHAEGDDGSTPVQSIEESFADPQSLRFVVVSIERQGKLLGRFVAVRSIDAPEFGTVEADLMKSTSMLLGVHLMNQRQFHQMQQMFDGMIQSLVSALDAKDAYTCGHSSRVADVAVELARRLGFDEDGIRRIRMAGMLHDVGKIGVEDSVLRKPGKLTAEEFEQIKQHPVLGYEILKGIRQFRNILPAVRHHHESIDGSGYPDGLAGDAIPRDAQVLAVADAFDAMTSDRPYRAGMPLQRVIDVFQKGRDQQWAADVVDTLLGSPEVMYAYSLKEQPLKGKKADKIAAKTAEMRVAAASSAGTCSSPTSSNLDPEPDAVGKTVADVPGPTR